MTKKHRPTNRTPVAGKAKKLKLSKDVLRDLPPASDEAANPRGGLSNAVGSIIGSRGTVPLSIHSRSGVA